MTLVTLIAFGGPSSSGKTTAAKAVQQILPNSSIIHLDDFYLPDDQIPVDAHTGELNWDCPEAIDFTKFVQHIKSIKNGDSTPVIQSIQPGVDLVLKEHEIDKLRTRASTLQDQLVVLVDGFMLFHDPKIIDLFDVKLFFHAPFETLKERRESRKGYVTVEGFWVDPPNYFENIVWPAYRDSHAYLFENQDANGKVTEEKKKELGFVDINNDKGSSLADLVEWSLVQILEYFSQ